MPEAFKHPQVQYQPGPMEDWQLPVILNSSTQTSILSSELSANRSACDSRPGLRKYLRLSTWCMVDKEHSSSYVFVVLYSA